MVMTGPLLAWVQQTGNPTFYVKCLKPIYSGYRYTHCMSSGKVPLESIVTLQNGPQTHSQVTRGVANVFQQDLAAWRSTWYSVWLCLKDINTPSVKQQWQVFTMQFNGDAWKWVWDPFSSITMHFNGPLPLLLCFYILKHSHLFSDYF